MSSDNPLITCIMVTGKSPERRPLAMAAAESFRRQTYANCRLIIISDGFSLGPFTDTRIQQLLVPSQPSLGHLRNIGLQVAGDAGLIMQWDDDDLCSPHRIRQQVEAWRSAGEPEAVLLRHETLLDLTTGSDTPRVITGERHAHHGFAGTILHKPLSVRYPETARGEDSQFVIDIHRNNGRIHSWKNPATLYYRTYHGRNTWNRQHFDKLLHGSRECSDPETKEARNIRWWASTLYIRGAACVTAAEVAERLGPIPWCRGGKGRYLFELVVKYGLKNIIEIGTLHGASTCYLAGAARKINGHVTTVDVPPSAHNLPRAEDTLRVCGLAETVTICRHPDGSNVLSTWAAGRTDLVYVDGNHTQAQVARDLQTAHRLLRPGGFVVCDDVGNKVWPEVEPAWQSMEHLWTSTATPGGIADYRAGRR